MKVKVDGSVGAAMFTLVEGLVFIALGIAVNHSFLADVDHDTDYPLGQTSFDILKIKNLFNNVSVAFFSFLVIASVLPPTAVRKNVPFFYAIYILIVMIVAVFMIAGIAVYTALYLNIVDYGTRTLSNSGKTVYNNRLSGTMAMLIVYSMFFFIHVLVTAYTIYHYFTWRVNMQRWQYDMEPSAMHYHNGMVNASYMHDRPPMDPRYWGPPPPGGYPGGYGAAPPPPGGVPPGGFNPPPGYSRSQPPPRDEKPGSFSNRSEASTNTNGAAGVGAAGPSRAEVATGSEAACTTGAEAPKESVGQNTAVEHSVSVGTDTSEGPFVKEASQISEQSNMTDAQSMDSIDLLG